MHLSAPMRRTPEFHHVFIRIVVVVSLVASAASVARDGPGNAVATTDSASDRWRSAPVRIDGLRRTREATVRHVLTHDEVTTSDRVQTDLDALDRLGVFAEVAVDSSGDTLVYRVRELPWLLPVPNGRISDEDGVALGAGIKTPNLFGRAVAGEFLFLIGRSREFQASVAGDRLGGHAMGFDLFAGRTDREDKMRGFDEESHIARMRLEAPTNRPWRAQGTIQVLDLGIDRGKSLSGDGRDLLASGSLGLVLDTRDRRSLVRRGVRAEASMERVGGDADGWMLLTDARLWQPLGGRWTLHGSFLTETQWGILGPWRTFVVGGANTARGVEAGALQGRSERLASLELRWLAMPVRPISLLGQDLYWGTEIVCGADRAEVPGDGTETAPFVSLDLVVPFLERLRLSTALTDGDDFRLAVDFGMFEKSAAQRFRVR